MSNDIIYEVIDILKYACDERDWNSVQESLDILSESIGESISNSELNDEE